MKETIVTVSAPNILTVGIMWIVFMAVLMVGAKLFAVARAKMGE